MSNETRLVKIKDIITRANKKQTTVLIKMLIMLLFGKHSSETLVVKDLLFKKKKTLIRHLKSDSKRKQLMRNVDLARSFLKSVAVILPKTVECYTEK